MAVLSTAATALLPSQQALAADADRYPTKPIKLIVGFAPGGVNDVVARALSVELTKVLGQPVYVENHSGAGGTIGVTTAMKAEPDGYTLVVTTPPQIAVAPLLLQHRPFDATKDLTPIATFALASNILVVNTALPVKNFAELVAYSKGPGQGKVRFGSGGTGSSGQLYGQVLNAAAGMGMIEVPYGASSVMAFPDLISGRIEANFAQVPGTIGFVRSGQVRPIVVLSEKRAPLLPDVPTIGEEGYPQAAMEFWLGVEAPAGTPPAIVAKLHTAIRTSMTRPTLLKNLEELGAQPFVSSPEEFSALQAREIARYTKLLTQLKLIPSN
jgi:tripartite-type tricarboxylate transporter receptor subunit TctC